MAALIVVDSRTRLCVDDVPENAQAALRERFEHKNPQHAMKRRLGLPVWDEPRTIVTWRKEKDGKNRFLSVPRGGIAKVREVLDEHQIDWTVRDQRNTGFVDAAESNMPGEYAWELYPYQARLADLAFGRESCLIEAPQGSGKTCALISLIPRVRCPVLIVVHASALLRQWREQLGEQLGMRADQIGVVQGQTQRLRPVTLAMGKTLAKCSGEAGVQRYFGAVFADECFEERAPVLMEDGTLKSIGEVRPGERVAAGGSVLVVSRRRAVVAVRLAGWRATDEHPVAVEGEGWVGVSSVRCDDVLWCDPLHVQRALERSVDAREVGASAFIGSAVEVPTAGDDRAEPRGGRRTKNLLPRIEGLAGAPLPGGVRLRRGRARIDRSFIAEIASVCNLETEGGVFVVGGVLVHNCHLFASKTLFDAIDPLPARYRIGATADVRRKDRKEFLIKELFGPTAAKVDEKELVESGHILDVEVRVVPTDFRADWYGLPDAENGGFDDVNRGLRGGEDRGVDRHRLLVEMMGDDDRNRLVLRLAREAIAEGEQVVVLAQYREHVMTFGQAISAMGTPCGYLIGGPDFAVEFERTKSGLKAGTLKAGSATYQAFGTGIDVPKIGTGIGATPIGANRQLFRQVRGRFCRTSTGKGGARFYYLWDRHVFPKHLKNLKTWFPRVVVFEDGGWTPAKEYIKRRAAAA